MGLAGGLASNGGLSSAVTSVSPVWASSTSNRAATDILMSTYDTNPASTDHTTAFQNALTAAAALLGTAVTKVRIVLDTRQKYTIGGAVTAGANGEWAQIPLPFLSSASGLSGSIQLVGIPRENGYGYLGGGTSGTVIESTLGAAPAFQVARGIASVFGGPASFSSARTSAGMYPAGFNYLRFSTKDITIRSASPVICGVDAGWLAGFNFDGLLQFDTDAMAAANPSNIAGGLFASVGSVCTAPQAIPLILPFHLDWYGTLGDTLVCAGWLGGPMLGEFAHIRRVFVFFTAGAALYLDGANQATRIDYLIDWNNAYGIATTNPGSGAAPIAPTSTAVSSGFSGPATPVDIGNWEVQTSQGGAAAAATQRVYDVMDPNTLTYVDCPSWVSTTDGNAYNPAPIILGAGSSTTGRAPYQRIITKLQNNASGLAPALPATGVAIRNPYGRNALVEIVGGTVSSVTVNDGATGFTTVVLVPANGTIIVNYTAAPSWKWQLM